MSIENPTLAHFRHFRHFSSLFTNSPLYICRERSTNQLLFMQNKPNFKVAQIKINSYMKSKYEKLDTWLSGKNKPNSNPKKANPELAEGAVEKFLSLCPESATIIRKYVIRQFKRGRLGWLLLGTVTKIILEHSPVGSGLNLEISCHANAILFGKDRF